MKKLIDMDRREEIGVIDWEFVYDMQSIAPDMISADTIILNRELLTKIPAKWRVIKQKLSACIHRDETHFLAVSDLENQGNEFKIEGTIRRRESGESLAFHRLMVFDKDRLEDDFIGSIVSDAAGKFALAFGKRTFSDFGFAESIPDLYFRVFSWDREKRFVEIARVMPKDFKVSHFPDRKVAIDFGVIDI
jgi:hypothetical protein